MTSRDQMAELVYESAMYKLQLLREKQWDEENHQFWKNVWDNTNIVPDKIKDPKAEKRLVAKLSKRFT